MLRGCGGKTCHLVPRWGSAPSYEEGGRCWFSWSRFHPSAQFPSAQASTGPSSRGRRAEQAWWFVGVGQPPISHMGSFPKSCVSLAPAHTQAQQPTDSVMESLPASVSSAKKGVQK